MRIFVTGASGVIGRRVVPQLVAAGHQVSAVVHSPAKHRKLEALGARPVSVDLFDAASIARSVPGHDTVINLATHVPHSTAKLLLPGAWRENDRLRRITSGLLVDAAIANGVARVIQESFAPVYAAQGDAWITETSQLRPVRYNRTGHSTPSRRPSGLLGTEVVDRAPLRGVLRAGLHPARRHAPERPPGMLPLPGDPEAFFSFVSHDDAAAAVVAGLSLASGAYNVVEDDPVTRRVLGETVAALLGVKPPRRPVPKWIPRLLGSIGELMSRSQRISNRKLREAGEWRPRYPSIREGLRATLEERRKAA